MSALKKLNRFISETVVKSKIPGHIIPVMLHKLYPDRSSVDTKWGSTVEGVTILQFEELLQWFAKRDYVFLSASELLKLDATNKQKKYAIITFDDGYFNNCSMLPLLEKYNAKATIFVNSYYIESAKKYWWDVVFCEYSKQGKSKDEIYQISNGLKQKSIQTIEAELVAVFGEKCLEPEGDLDRPMAVEELKNLAKSPHIEIGNHTHTHISMDTNNGSLVEEELFNAAEKIEQWTGKRPIALAYPFGDKNEMAIASAKANGLAIGFTTVEGKILLEDWKNTDPMQIHRNHILGWYGIDDQLYNTYSGYSFINSILKR